MSYTTLLINSCAVLEDTGVGPDTYGHKTPNWTTVEGYGDIACRLMPGKGKEILVGAEVVVADYKLFLEDITITEQNRVMVYAGTPVAWVEYEILLVSNIQDGASGHHKECWLRTVR